MGLKINEIFFSLQGESTYSGRPCVFIRLTGCNLRCRYCDTQYAYEEGKHMEIPHILQRVTLFDCSLVEVTGGEPLIQEETPALLRALVAGGYTVLLETNGSIDIRGLDPACARIVDVKCPSSGMAGKNDLRNLRRLTERDELKFVMGCREDYDFARSLIQAHDAQEIPCVVNFSPVFGHLSPATLAAWILEDRLPVRLNLQLHKVLWDPERRGV